MPSRSLLFKIEFGFHFQGRGNAMLMQESLPSEYLVFIASSVSFEVLCSFKHFFIIFEITVCFNDACVTQLS